MEDNNYFLPTPFQINQRVGKLSSVASHIWLLTSFKKTQTFIATSICTALKNREGFSDLLRPKYTPCPRPPHHPWSFWFDFVWFCPGRTQWREQIMSVVLITVWRERLLITIQYVLIDWLISAWQGWGSWVERAQWEFTDGSRGHNE